MSAIRTLARVLAFAGALGALALSAPLQAYTPQRGEPFFLLSDASYGTDAEAMVRLEAGSIYSVADYGGVDVRVYRIPKPLDFLQHRIQVLREPVEFVVAAAHGHAALHLALLDAVGGVVDHLDAAQDCAAHQEADDGTEHDHQHQRGGESVEDGGLELGFDAVPDQ